MTAPRLRLREERGWFGMFTREQASGAGVIPNGTRIVKAWCEPGDAHRTGALGTVLGSFRGRDPRTGVDMLCYFVAWDDRPRFPVATFEPKIARAEPSP